jgi:Transglutaminase-like superfamily
MSTERVNDIGLSEIGARIWELVETPQEIDSVCVGLQQEYEVMLSFKAVCMPRTMAARVMLKRRGVQSGMHFDAAKGHGKPLDADAWLDAAGVKVTGYPLAESFAEIACFV